MFCGVDKPSAGNSFLLAVLHSSNETYKVLNLFYENVENAKRGNLKLNWMQVYVNYYVNSILENYLTQTYIIVLEFTKTAFHIIKY